jgi:hypothetical protein
MGRVIDKELDSIIAKNKAVSSPEAIMLAYVAQSDNILKQ